MSNCFVSSFNHITIFSSQGVEEINVKDNKVCGVTLHDGTVVESNIVLSNATPKVEIIDRVQSWCLKVEIISFIALCLSGFNRTSYEVQKFTGLRQLAPSSPSFLQ
jgi:hypothetical protein